ncbi:MAG: hypothetical protein L7T24_02285 [Luminiphilus sp.]|nr:hypothetical protein [Luminiphilus sp.]
MTHYANYQLTAHQITTHLEKDFGIAKADIGFIKKHIIETDAFRNDVIAAQRSVPDWHRSFTDVAMAIVECGRGELSKKFLRAYAIIAAGSELIAQSLEGAQPIKSPEEQYAIALATVTELNEAASEAELEPAPKQLSAQS